MPPPYARHLFVCTNERPADNPRGCCKLKGSERVLAAFKEAIRTRGLAAEVRANSSGCLDACAKGVSVVVYPDGVWYGGLTPEEVDLIVREHLVEGRPVERLLMT